SGAQLGDTGIVPARGRLEPELRRTLGGRGGRGIDLAAASAGGEREDRGDDCEVLAHLGPPPASALRPSSKIGSTSSSSAVSSASGSALGPSESARSGWSWTSRNSPSMPTAV